MDTKLRSPVGVSPHDSTSGYIVFYAPTESMMFPVTNDGVLPLNPVLLFHDLQSRKTHPMLYAPVQLSQIDEMSTP